MAPGFSRDPQRSFPVIFYVVFVVSLAWAWIKESFMTIWVKHQTDKSFVQCRDFWWDLDAQDRQRSSLAVSIFLFFFVLYQVEALVAELTSRLRKHNVYKMSKLQNQSTSRDVARDEIILKVFSLSLSLSVSLSSHSLSASNTLNTILKFPFLLCIWLQFFFV